MTPWHGMADAVETYSRNTPNVYQINTNLILAFTQEKGMIGIDFGIDFTEQEIAAHIIPTKDGKFDWKAEPLKTYTASYRNDTPLDVTGALLAEATNWLNGK